MKGSSVLLWYQPHPSTPGDTDIPENKCIYSSHPMLEKEENRRDLSSPVHRSLYHRQSSLSKAAPSVSARSEKQHAHKHSAMPHWASVQMINTVTNLNHVTKDSKKDHPPLVYISFPDLLFNKSISYFLPCTRKAALRLMFLFAWDNSTKAR